MGWFGLLESRTEGMSATELVERHLCWKAPLFGKSFSERGLPPPALYYGETDRSRSDP
jgi:hypothetical protein